MNWTWLFGSLVASVDEYGHEDDTAAVHTGFGFVKTYEPRATELLRLSSEDHEGVFGLRCPGVRLSGCSGGLWIVRQNNVVLILLSRSSGTTMPLARLPKLLIVLISITYMSSGTASLQFVHARWGGTR